MKNRRIFIGAIMLLLILVLSACSKSTMTNEMTSKEGKSTGTIYLYGEEHGVEKILDKELEEWEKHYNNEGMRHLFVELPYYNTEFLNSWMQADNDDILEALYTDIEGTAAHKPEVKAFYKKIKAQCPETIFHGTDVGHQYDTTGKRYLEYLKEHGLENTEEYTLAEECIAQGEYFYEHKDAVYRENEMVLNFVREFDALGNENIMGIYGSAHTGLDAKNITGDLPCMATQLKKRYGQNIQSEDLSSLAKEIEAYSIETIKVNDKAYKASYFGKQDLTGFKDYVSREYWRLEDAYDDFKDNTKVGNVLPYDNYPMTIEVGQVFVIDYEKTDGSIEREYYRADGEKWQNQLTTVEIVVD